MQTQDHIRWFRDLRISDVPLVGGKNASLGELYTNLSREGIRVPNGFALTAQSYRDAVTRSAAWEKLHALLDGLDKAQVDILSARAAEAREIVFTATASAELAALARRRYRHASLGRDHDARSRPSRQGRARRRTVPRRDRQIVGGA